MFRKLREIQGHAGAIYTCAYDGTYIYTGSADKFITRWIPETGEQDQFAIRFEQSIYALEVMGKFLFAGLSDGALHIFDLEERKELKHYVQHTKAIFSIHKNERQNRMYVSDADGNLSVWDTETLELVIYLPLDAGKIRDIAFAENDVEFALACQDGTLRVMEAEYFNEIMTVPAHKDGTTAVLFHPDRKEVLLSGGKDAMLREWNWKDSEQRREIPAHNFAIYRLIHVGNQLVSASRDKTVKIWDKDLDFIQRLDNREGGHRHSVNDLARMTDMSFVSVGDDQRIILWTINQ